MAIASVLLLTSVATGCRDFMRSMKIPALACLSSFPLAVPVWFA